MLQQETINNYIRKTFKNHRWALSDFESYSKGDMLRRYQAVQCYLFVFVAFGSYLASEVFENKYM